MTVECELYGTVNDGNWVDVFEQEAISVSVASRDDDESCTGSGGTFPCGARNEQLVAASVRTIVHLNLNSTTAPVSFL
jgi:hypothetical protein